MRDSRLCQESASAVAQEARRRRIQAWAAEMNGLQPPVALELAALWDQAVELGPYLTDEEQRFALDQVSAKLRTATLASAEALCSRLPVFTGVARNVVQIAGEAETTFDDLARLAKSDPVLAGSVIAAANSSLFGPRQPVAQIEHAIAHLGSDTTRNILLAAAMRNLIGGSRHHALWSHSLATAQVADRLARTSRRITPGEAFLAGLVHDIGRLAIMLVPEPALERAGRLVAAGCPLLAVERALFGVEHTSLGAEILERWRFGPLMQQAARFHHEPERSDSPHAALIYLALFRIDCNHDLPSMARLQSACATAGIELRQAVGVAFDESRAFLNL